MDTTAVRMVKCQFQILKTKTKEKRIALQLWTTENGYIIFARYNCVRRTHIHTLIAIFCTYKKVIYISCDDRT